MSCSNEVEENAEEQKNSTNAQDKMDQYLDAISKFYPPPEERKAYANHTIFEKLLLLIKVNIGIIPKFTKTDPYKKTGASNWSISAEVYDRLLLRHTILNQLETLETTYKVHQDLVRAAEESKKNTEPEKVSLIDRIGATHKNNESKKDKSLSATENPHLRAYRIAATDLFVEKAIAYLEIDCNKYTRRGIILFGIGIFFIFIGILSSGINAFECGADFIASIVGENHCKKITDPASASIKYGVKYVWAELVSKFTRGFTFYGMIVLLAVGCWRLGKAMLDQAERLRERRHSLRQGRLFIHLNNGNVTIEQLEKAFDWNVSKGNAFANIETEASAPWGAVLKEAVKVLPEIFRRAKDSGGK